VHETIYQAVYRPELGGLGRDLPPVRQADSVPASCGAGLTADEDGILADALRHAGSGKIVDIN
jgi:hypothetical protein